MRILSLCFCFLLLGSACSKDKSRESVEGTSSPATNTATPASTAAEVPGVDGQPGGGSEFKSTLPPNATSGPKPSEPRNPGAVNRPRIGDYTYSLEGRSKSPFDPAGSEFPPGAQTTASYAQQGDLYTVRVHSEVGATQTTDVRWFSDRVVLERLEISVPGRVYTCTYNPPLVVARLPLAPGEYARQQAQGDDCSGSLDLRVVGRENVTVGAGTFSAWKFTQSLEYRFGSELSGKATGDVWLSTALGVEVKADQRNNATFQQQNVESEEHTALIRFP